MEELVRFKQIDEDALSKTDKAISGWIPFARIAVNVMGPFPLSEDGNQYVLVAMEATTVAEISVDNLFSRFGVP